MKCILEPIKVGISSDNHSTNSVEKKTLTSPSRVFSLSIPKRKKQIASSGLKVTHHPSPLSSCPPITNDKTVLISPALRDEEVNCNQAIPSTTRVKFADLIQVEFKHLSIDKKKGKEITSEDDIRKVEEMISTNTLSKATTKELKAFLRRKQLKITGKKEELIGRILSIQVFSVCFEANYPLSNAWKYI